MSQIADKIKTCQKNIVSSNTFMDMIKQLFF